jgi:hypothetical protein
MLTDKQCKNASCDAGRPRVRLADSGGLYLEVSPSGSKRWFWKYRFDGKEKRLALGGYPDLGLNLDPAVTRPPAAPAAASVARWRVQCGR